MNILLITQDKHLYRNLYKDFLIFSNVDFASGEEEALRKFFENKYDLILLDSPFNKKNSFDLLREIREDDKEIPLIYLTYETEERIIIKALQYGADDVLTKPFYAMELKARINNNLKKFYQVEKEETLSFNNLSFNFNHDSFYVSKNKIKIPRKEYFLLRYLLFNKNKVLSKHELYEKIWNNDAYASSNTVDVHISRLRKRLEESDAKVKIENHYGFGYALKSS